MRTMASMLAMSVAERGRVDRRQVLARFLALVAGLVVVFSAAFHLLMHYEGRGYSLLTGAYWTLTTMTTLGFGDITFASDAGRAFSIVVMLTGVLVFQILLTFFVIQYLYLPWVEAREAARIPRRIDEGVRAHVVLTQDNELARAVVAMLRRNDVPAVVLGGTPAETARIRDEGVPAIVGSFDDPQAYRNAGIERASLAVATGGALANANAVVTLRETAPKLPVLSDSADDLADNILQLAGADGILRRGVSLGEAMARLVPGGRRTVHPIGSFHGLVVAEIAVAGTGLAGRAIAATGLKARGITALGTRAQDRFRMARAEQVIAANEQLVVAGPAAALAALDRELPVDIPPPRAVILGGGRVGRAAAADLARRSVPAAVVESDPARAQDGPCIPGDAADPAVLDRAGIAAATAVLITTHDDDLNVFLAILVRRQAPQARIIARVVRDRNISTLYRAGADAVLSGLTLAAEDILARIRPASVQVLSEGVMLVNEPVDPAWAGRTLAELALPARFGLQVVAVIDQGGVHAAPAAGDRLPAGGRILAVRSLARADAAA